MPEKERMKNKKMWADGAKNKGQRVLRIRVSKLNIKLKKIYIYIILPVPSILVKTGVPSFWFFKIGIGTGSSVPGFSVSVPIS